MVYSKLQPIHPLNHLMIQHCINQDIPHSGMNLRKTAKLVFGRKNNYDNDDEYKPVAD